MTEDNIDSTRSRIQSMLAQIQAIEGQVDEALRSLDGRTDAGATKRRLAILLEAKRFGAAADLVRGAEPNERWVVQAIQAFCHNGELARAKELVSWSDTCEATLRHKCALALAETLLASVSPSKQLLQSSCPEASVSDADKATLREVISTLLPILQRAMARASVDTELEELALSYYFRAALMVGERGEAGKAAKLLTSRNPVPILVATAALEGIIAPPPDLPSRLREEHEGEFAAEVLALALDGEVAGKAEHAFNGALALMNRAKSPEDRESLTRVLCVLAQHVGPDAAKQIASQVPSLGPSAASFLPLLTVQDHIRKQRFEEAEALLEDVKDESDPHWLQMHAILCLERGDTAAAAPSLLSAAKKLLHPDLLRRAASLLFETGDYTNCVWVLEQLVEVNPADATAVRNLAVAHMCSGDQDAAGQHFSRLRDLQPDSLEAREGYAQTLALSLRLQESLEAYDELCRRDSSSVHARLARAQILLELGRAREALESLREHRSHFWDSPSFVSAYASLAYRAGGDREGAEGLKRLKELQDEGRLSQPLLRPVSLEDMVAQIKAGRVRADEIHEAVVYGKTSWLLADAALGQPWYRGWKQRTQPLDWVFDTPANRAAFCVYSTNGFAVRRGEGDQPATLRRLRGPSQRSGVVADVSALITLHELGLLSRAADFLGQITVPAAYMSAVFDEHCRLASLQTSRRGQAEELSGAVTGKRLGVVPAEDHGLLVLDEYAEDAPAPEIRGLLDVVDTLFVLGLATESQRTDLEACANRPRSAPVAQGSSLVAARATLRTLQSLGLFDSLLQVFDVNVTARELAEARSELEAFRLENTLRESHAALWQIVRSHPAFSFAPHVTPPSLRRQEPRSSSVDVVVAAILLSSQEAVPLLSDDRLAQQTRLNEPPQDCSNAFGTDLVLTGMWRDGLLTREEAARALLQLSKWRYRFLVFPFELLKGLADEHRENPPGWPLRTVAGYLHDCLQDPGLFGGEEPTNPPMSIALKFGMSWVFELAKLTVAVWEDRSYSDRSASELTNWIVSDFLCSSPRAAVPMDKHPNLQDAFASQFFTTVLLQATEATSQERLNRCLQQVALALGLDKEAYLAEAMRVLRAI